jgi:hypothetical protein
MPGTTEDHLKDVATLTKAVENVFRKLIRFLVGKISLVKLQEMVRTIFIEEAEDKFRKRHPNRNVSLTKLALVSGLDTRTIIKIRNSSSYRKPFHRRGTFLSDFTPGASILDTWNSKEPYIDSETGSPITLDVSGTTLSFESLFADSVKSRGVTANSLLRRLVESGSVSLDQSSQKVSLTKLTYLPVETTDRIGAIEMGFGAIGSLLDTVLYNLSGSTSVEDRLFQRGTWTFRLSEQRKPKARTELRILLEETDDRARDILQKYEEPAPGPHQLAAGVGYYYFEEGGAQD